MQRFDFTGLAPGSERRGAACVRSREARETKGGKEYLVLELGNATGAASARIWSESLPEWEDIPAGAAVDLHARVQAGWRGGAPELSVVSVKQLPDDHEVRLELNPHSPVSREELEARLTGLVESIRRPQARQLLDLVFDCLGRERFATAPAAVSHHHAYIGGLLEHSVEVAELAVAMASAERYASLIDRDMTIVGALLHDLGKLESYQWEGVPIRISRAGRLRSHVTRGAEIVAVAVSNGWAIESGAVSQADVDLLRHVIESHHGQSEWGSPTPPRCLEATVIHLADLASARLRAMADDLESAPADEEHWVDPPGWGRGPVWDFRSTAAEAEAAARSAPRLKMLSRSQPAGLEGETAAYLFPPKGGDDA